MNTTQFVHNFLLVDLHKVDLYDVFLSGLGATLSFLNVCQTCS